MEIDEQELKIAKVIDVTGQKIEIIQDITEKTKQERPFIYMDPPYYPVCKKDGKISPYKLYNGDYLPADFVKLKLRCDELTRAGVPFILSNSNCDFIKLLFCDYNLVEVKEPRGIKKENSENKRPAESCLLITNFKEKEDFMDGIKSMNNVLEDSMKEKKINTGEKLWKIKH